MLRRDPSRRDRARELLADALATFGSFGLHGWSTRAQAVVDRLAEAGRTPYSASISKREAEVLRLIARGHTDRQIADALYISLRTVNAHVRDLLAKTDRANRTDLSLWAVAQGIAAQSA